MKSFEERFKETKINEGFMDNIRKGIKTSVAATAIGAAALTNLDDAPKNLNTANTKQVQPNKQDNLINDMRKYLPTTNVDGVKLYEMLKLHEGYKTKVYNDSLGIPTVGIGYNLNWNIPLAKKEFQSIGLDYDKVKSGQVELSDKEIKQLYNKSMVRAYYDVKDIYPEFHLFPEEIQMVLLDMNFNLGKTRFSGFKKTHQLFKLGIMAEFQYRKTGNIKYWQDAQKSYNAAAKEMLDSKWAKQVKGRSVTLSNMVINTAKNLRTK